MTKFYRFWVKVAVKWEFFCIKVIKIVGKCFIKYIKNSPAVHTFQHLFICSFKCILIRQRYLNFWNDLEWSPESISDPGSTLAWSGPAFNPFHILNTLYFRTFNNKHRIWVLLLCVRLLDENNLLIHIYDAKCICVVVIMFLNSVFLYTVHEMLKIRLLCIYLRNNETYYLTQN